MNVIKIKDRLIGDGYPAYIIAEMSANHSGSIERAKRLSGRRSAVVQIV